LIQFWRSLEFYKLPFWIFEMCSERSFSRGFQGLRLWAQVSLWALSHL